MNTLLIYYSATGNTAKIAKVLMNSFNKFGVSVEYYNICENEKRVALAESLDLSKFDGFIFGSPVYAYRTPKFIREWIKKLNGKKIKTALFFTYGGVSPGAVHNDTIRMFQERNFNVISTAEFLGKHTFNLAGWDLLEERPNKRDFKVAKDYAKIIFKRFKAESKKCFIEIQSPALNEKTLKRIRKRAFDALKPPNFLENCTSCGICEQNCPTNAIDLKDQSIDIENCMRCLKCVQICPENALEVQNISNLLSILKKIEDLTEESVNKKESKIYL
jgi:ferredoxin